MFVYDETQHSVSFFTLKQLGEDAHRFVSGGLMTIPILQPFTDEMNEAYRYIESANYYLSVLQDSSLSSQDRLQALVHAKNAITQAQNLFIEIQQKNAQDNSQEQYAREGLLSYQRIAQQVAAFEHELAHS